MDIGIIDLNIHYLFLVGIETVCRLVIKDTLLLNTTRLLLRVLLLLLNDFV